MQDRPSPRLRLLGKLAGGGHRYARYRAASMSATLGVLLAVPLLGLARFDAWRGAHLVLGRPARGIEAFLAVGAGIGIFYLVTFLVNAAFGRAFCGWGCPVAQLSRLGEELEIAWRQGTARGRCRGTVRAVAFAALLSLAILLWWVSPRVFLEGSWTAIATTGSVWAASTAAGWLHGRWWRWGFCRTACPIGVYYSIVALERPLRIVFDEGLGTCKDCHACDLICPVRLDPRRLDDPVACPGGLAIDGLRGHQHCLRCGDCVMACEHVFRRETAARVPLRFGHGAGPPEKTARATGVNSPAASPASPP